MVITYNNVTLDSKSEERHRRSRDAEKRVDAAGGPLAGVHQRSRERMRFSKDSLCARPVRRSDKFASQRCAIIII